METLTSLAISTAISLSFIAPLFVCLGVLYLVRKHQSGKSVTPLSENLLRPAGFSVNGQLADRMWDLAAYFSFAPLALLILPVTFVGKAYFLERQVTAFEWVLAITGSLLLFGFLLRRILTALGDVRRYRLGAACEMAVGQELDQLMRHGWRAFHDVPANGFNIDHIMVGSGGVFAIETKGRSKPLAKRGDHSSKQWKVELKGGALHFPAWVERKPLEQSRLAAKWVSEWLTKATGREVPVQGVLVLPGWYIERKERSELLVINAKNIQSVFSRMTSPRLSEEQATAIAWQIEQKVRDVDRERIQHAA